MEPPASENFTDILNYLFKESPEAANIVGNAILDEVELLAGLPFSHPADRFKRKKDENYRACVVYSYRISYYVGDSAIHILRIRHTSREPLGY